MTSQLEYHKAVQRSIPASFALLGLLVAPVFLASSSYAQITGVPSSVTSPGFGGRPINGTPPSVTSLGPRGFTPPNSFVTFGSQVPFRDNGRHHHHRDHDRDRAFVPYIPYYGAYAVPVPYADNSAYDSEDESDYQGGPTIFDRRGSGAQSYIPPQNDPSPAHAKVESASPPPETPQPPTILVFKDGHQLEVGNYAIVGDTLYDLTPGHPRKIALVDLDLPATQKQNDDRGVTFQLPPSAQAN